MPDTKANEVELKPSENVLAKGPLDFAQAILTGSWKTMKIDELLQFRTDFAAVVGAIGKLRSKFDEAVWAGHSDGTVDVRVKSVRQQRTGDSGGRKATVKTIEEQLLG